MQRPSRRVTASAVAAVTIAGSVLLTGCSERSPIQSTKPYQPSDGVVANLDTLAVRNLLVISDGAGKPGVLSGALVNSGTQELDVTFTTANATAASEPIPVLPGQLVRLGSGTGDVHVQFSTVDQPPGGMVQVAVATPQTGPTTLQVPVLPPELEYSGITPSAEPTATSTETPTDTPSPASTS